MNFLAALLLLAGLLTPEQYEHRTEGQANQAREAHDVARLPHGPCVAKFARSWAEHLATTGELHHQELARPVRRCNGTSVGELLVHGDVEPRQAIALWMDSKPHRRILLARRYDHMAAGSARDAHGAWVVSIVFIEHSS